MIISDNTVRYYVIKTTRQGVEFKRYKCIDGWSRTKENCWKFSKQGAQQIADRLNKECKYEEQAYPKTEHYNILIAGEN